MISKIITFFIEGILAIVIFGGIGVLFNSDLLFILPPEFRYAAFANQCILKNRITGQKPVVVILEYIVGIVSRLLPFSTLSLIVRTDWMLTALVIRHFI